MKTTIIITMLIVLSGCTIPRKNSTVGKGYTPAQSELLGALVGAGIGVGLGSALNTGIDEKLENYGTSTYSGKWNNKPRRNESGGRKGGYSVRSGYQNVSRYTTKNHKGNNMVGMALQTSQMGAYYGRQIGIENQTRKLQEENEKLKQQIIQLENQ